MMAKQFNLKENEILNPKNGTLRQLVTYAPKDFADEIRQALNDAGAGNIGKYDNCSFNIEGTGVFRATESANPYSGEKGVTHFEKEIRISVIFPKHNESNILKDLINANPYEEIAYEIFDINT